MGNQETNNTTITDPSAYPTSPHYLHPSDSQYRLVSEKFNGSSFNDWKRSVVISLSSKNKLSFIDGSIQKPSVDYVLYKPWKRVNNTLISWFIQVLDANTARSILYFDSAEEVWNNLEEGFGQTTGSQIFSLQQQIVDVHQQDNESLSACYTKMKMLWDELNAANPLPMCTCNRCTCRVIAQNARRKQANSISDEAQSKLQEC